jgi:hypothetical protein
VFPMCSHHVPWSSSSSQVVPQNFPNCTSVLSHMVCPKFNPHVCKLKRGSIEEHFCFYLQLKVERGASIGECPMFQKHWWWANECSFLVFFFIKCSIPMNMNHTNILKRANKRKWLLLW